MNLPPQGNENATASGEIVEPREMTALELADSLTIVNANFEDSPAASRLKWDFQWGLDAHAFVNYYDEAQEARRSLDQFAEADVDALTKETGWPQKKAEAIKRLARIFRTNLNRASDWLEQHDNLYEDDLTSVQRALHENKIRQDILNTLTPKELSQIDSPDLRDSMQKAFQGDSSIPVATLIEGFISARLRKTWYHRAVTQYSTNLQNARDLIQPLDMLLSSAQNYSDGDIGYEIDERSFWKSRVRIDPNQPVVSFETPRPEKAMEIDLFLSPNLDVINFFQGHFADREGKLKRETGQDYDKLSVETPDGERWTILSQTEAGQEVVYIEFEKPEQLDVKVEEGRVDSHEVVQEEGKNRSIEIKMRVRRRVAADKTQKVAN